MGKTGYKVPGTFRSDTLCKQHFTDMFNNILVNQNCELFFTKSYKFLEKKYLFLNFLRTNAY